MTDREFNERLRAYKEKAAELDRMEAESREYWKRPHKGHCVRVSTTHLPLVIID